MNLTAHSVAALKLPAGENDRIWFDDTVPGFGLRVRGTGGRSWIYQYKIKRKTRRFVIGSASAIKVGRAREIASELHAKVRLGGDPATVRHQQVERASRTFGALVERYLAQQQTELRPGSFREVNRHLAVHAKPLHALPVDTVDQRTIADRLQRNREKFWRCDGQSSPGEHVRNVHLGHEGRLCLRQPGDTHQQAAGETSRASSYRR